MLSRMLYHTGPTNTFFYRKKLVSISILKHGEVYKNDSITHYTESFFYVIFVWPVNLVLRMFKSK